MEIRNAGTWTMKLGVEGSKGTVRVLQWNGFNGGGIKMAAEWLERSGCIENNSGHKSDQRKTEGPDRPISMGFDPQKHQVRILGLAICFKWVALIFMHMAVTVPNLGVAHPFFHGDVLPVILIFNMCQLLSLARLLSTLI